jgi:hypothetical protein
MALATAAFAGLALLGSAALAGSAAVVGDVQAREAGR